jgi:diamine N-acetyltransferase
MPVLEMAVTDAQTAFVANNAQSIAEAHFEPHAWFRAIYADETPVGFLMMYDDPGKPQYFLWRFMIDARFQALGFGKQALNQLVEHVKTRPGASELGVSCVPAPDGPCPFYEKFGFVYTGEEDEGELVMTLKL